MTPETGTHRGGEDLFVADFYPQLGEYLAEQHATGYDTGPGRARFLAWLTEQAPQLVFYPAGFTWVDGCERDPDQARSANLTQPLNLARVAAERGARFVF